MKKSYVKPQVYFESFQLSADIAGNCGAKVHHSEECTMIEGIGTLYSDINTCQFMPGDDTNPLFCHHNPDDARRLFAS